jgi:hypothetical protein
MAFFSSSTTITLDGPGNTITYNLNHTRKKEDIVDDQNGWGPMATGKEEHFEFMYSSYPIVTCQAKRGDPRLGNSQNWAFLWISWTQNGLPLLQE